MQPTDQRLVERESIVVHRGTSILRHDYSGLHGQPFIDTLMNHKQAVIDRNQQDMRVLLLIQNAIVDKEVIAAFKEAGLSVKPLYSKVAMVGFTGVQKFFIQVVSRFTKINPELFDTEEEALDWLAQ